MGEGALWFEGAENHIQRRADDVEQLGIGYISNGEQHEKEMDPENN